MRNQTLTLNVPHRLTQDEARARIAAGVDEARTQYAGSFAKIEDCWTGNHMDFHVSILGQSISGRVDVGPEMVHVEIDLPWILAALAERIRPQLQDRTRKMLEAAPAH